MIDVIHEIDAIRRETATASLHSVDGHAVRLERTYDAPIDDVWDALTNPERIRRWFLPIHGDLHVGGHYQLEGQAGGDVLACDPPHRFRVTWVFGDPGDAPPSELEIRLTPGGDGRTRLELDHVAVVPAEMWSQFGPGAVGVGWDMAVLGLGLHLRGESVGDPVAWQLSAEGRDYATRSSNAWGAAHAASGEDRDAVASAVANTTAFYAPEPEAT